MHLISNEDEIIYRGKCNNCGAEWQEYEHKLKITEEINGKICGYSKCLKCDIGGVILHKVGDDELV